MKVLIFGKNTESLESLLKSQGFEIVNSNPDLIISFGGDGTLLSCERKYPGVPKLPIRNSQVCNKCANHEDEVVLKNLLAGKLKLEEYKKLETEILFKKFFALNDFVIRNSDATHTIRFKVNVPSHPERSEGSLIIGDGIVISTPFGSSGYFKSITQQTFKDGLGLAFNNATEKKEPILLKDKDIVNFNLLRGKATLSFDNSPDIFTIDEGSELIFKLSDQIAKIYSDTSLRCPNCKVIRG